MLPDALVQHFIIIGWWLCSSKGIHSGLLFSIGIATLNARKICTMQPKRTIKKKKKIDKNRNEKEGKEEEF